MRARELLKKIKRSLIGLMRARELQKEERTVTHKVDESPRTAKRGKSGHS
jgi:hypothetical protein